MDIKANMEVINSGELLAVGSITIDQIFTIKPVKAIGSKEDPNAWFVSLPTVKNLDGWQQIIKADPTLQEQIKEAVWQGIKDTVFLELPIEVKMCKLTTGRALAKATVIYNDLITISNIKVMNGKNGLFVSFPMQKTTFQNQVLYKDIITMPENVKKAMEKKILEEYKKLEPEIPSPAPKR